MRDSDRYHQNDTCSHDISRIFLKLCWAFILWGSFVLLLGLLGEGQLGQYLQMWITNLNPHKVTLRTIFLPQMLIKQMQILTTNPDDVCTS